MLSRLKPKNFVTRIVLISNDLGLFGVPYRLFCGACLAQVLRCFLQKFRQPNASGNSLSSAWPISARMNKRWVKRGTQSWSAYSKRYHKKAVKSNLRCFANQKIDPLRTREGYFIVLTVAGAALMWQNQRN
jgi:hypothetical protein